jgi:hypothetical protein
MGHGATHAPWLHIAARNHAPWLHMRIRALITPDSTKTLQNARQIFHAIRKLKTYGRVSGQPRQRPDVQKEEKRKSRKREGKERGGTLFYN